MNTHIGCSATRFTALLPATPRGARQARLLAVGQAVAWGLDGEPVGMVVGELAANAVTHGRVPGRDFRVVLGLAGRVLRIEVVDARGDRIPCPRDADPGSEGGRGLVLVAALADRWGVEEGVTPCKAVWAELDLPGDRREP
ncbi:ATP-binding protein [Streptomyces lavendulae subsp. lavendulae]|uniref:ATP-binding protein n=1 Tax=Streptomyces lavendulae TaxID=1914 RepID=UPI0024A0BEB8|nr:ATP-binding protein [Streptomyces lavendulae]GLV83912.1 ATP-binding protein [Streptomyces lavendulae subsp. lavendulae]